MPPIGGIPTLLLDWDILPPPGGIPTHLLDWDVLPPPGGIPSITNLYQQEILNKSWFSKIFVLL